MSKITVYEVTCSANDARYVGITNNLASRKRSHKSAANTGSDAVFHRAVRKHGFDSFTFAVRAELPTYEEAFIAERMLIALEKPKYNMSLGGEGSRVEHSDEWRQRQSQVMTGRKHTEETKQAIGRAHKDKNVSQSTRAKLSVASKASIQRNGHPMQGKKQSPETALRISLKKRANSIAKRVLAAATSRSKEI